MIPVNKSIFSFRIFSRKLIKSFSSYDVHVIFLPRIFLTNFLLRLRHSMGVQMPTLAMAQSPVQQPVRLRLIECWVAKKIAISPTHLGRSLLKQGEYELNYHYWLLTRGPYWYLEKMGSYLSVKIKEEQLKRIPKLKTRLNKILENYYQYFL